MKIMTIFGTRPEIIRLWSTINEIEKRKSFEHVMVNTNQNSSYNMNKLFLEELGIREPDYNLKITTESPGKEIADIISKSEEVLKKEKPDILVILGDTHSGLAAIPAAHHDISIAHIEAGMRSYDWRMPEEKNRVIIDHLSTVLFPYTEYSRQNLLRENIPPYKIHVVGNPIHDVLNHFKSKIEGRDILNSLGVKKGEYFLVTCHRKENVDEPGRLESIIKTLDSIGKRYGVKIIYPIHPRTKSKISGIKVPGTIKMIDPVGFLDFSNLEMNAACILTDSGTVQEDALYFSVPCVTIRESTEKHETINCGSNILSGLDSGRVLSSVEAAMNTEQNWSDRIRFEILGDGKTGIRIANILRGVLYK